MRKTISKFNDTRRGFTLIETLVYLIILALMLTVVVNTLLSMAKAYSTLSVNKNLSVGAVASMERIVRELRQAESVDQANSILGTSPGKLVLNTTDSAGSPTTVEFSVLVNTLIMKSGGATLGPLTLASTTVDSLVFRLITTPVSQAVKVELAMTSTEGINSKSEDFYATTILRGSYSQ